MKIRTYECWVYFWNSYSDEVNFEMIQYIIKNGGFAYTYSMETQKLYRVFLKDGNNLYTDLGGYRKILKTARERGVEIDVI